MGINPHPYKRVSIDRRKIRRVTDEQKKENRRRYQKELYHNNIKHRISTVIRSRLLQALKDKLEFKWNTAFDLLGCTIDEFCRYIESLWKVDMNWDNHRRDGWHIDHIRPCSSFDLTDPEQQKQCFHYTNMQPLWAIDNLKKSDRTINSPLPLSP